MIPSLADEILQILHVGLLIDDSSRERLRVLAPKIALLEKALQEAESSNAALRLSNEQMTEQLKKLQSLPRFSEIPVARLGRPHKKIIEWLSKRESESELVISFSCQMEVQTVKEYLNELRTLHLAHPVVAKPNHWQVTEAAKELLAKETDPT